MALVQPVEPVPVAASASAGLRRSTSKSFTHGHEMMPSHRSSRTKLLRAVDRNTSKSFNHGSGRDSMSRVRRTQGSHLEMSHTSAQTPSFSRPISVSSVAPASTRLSGTTSRTNYPLTKTSFAPTLDMASQWHRGDYVLAKYRHSDDYFAGHIQHIHGHVFEIVFDDGSVDANVPAANIQTRLDPESLLDVVYIPLDDLDENDHELALDAVSTPLMLDLAVLEKIKQAMPSVAHKIKFRPEMLHRTAAVLYTADDDYPPMFELSMFSYFTRQTAQVRHMREQQIQRLSTALSQVCLTSTDTTTTSVGDVVLVHTQPKCFFGNVQAIVQDEHEPSFAVLDIASNTVHPNVPATLLQTIDPRGDLSSQLHELLKLHDTLNPGAKVLVPFDAHLSVCTIRRRHTATRFDVQCDKSSNVLRHVKLDQLIAAPRPPNRKVTVVNQKSLVCGGTLFRQHERVAVQDEWAVTSGYITGINSNELVVIEYDNGQIDTCVPLKHLRKGIIDWDGNVDEFTPQPTPIARHAQIMDQNINYSEYSPMTIGIDPPGNAEETMDDDWVVLEHPISKAIERAKIATLHGNEFCDVEFLDGVVLTQVSLHNLERAGSLKFMKPSIFNTHDHVLAFNPRFKKYCTGQVAAVVERTYRIVFDYGETYEGVPHAMVTTLLDRSVLSPTKRITHNWVSANGFAADSVLCRGDIALHKAMCLPNIDTAAARATLTEGEAVLAQYCSSGKYFPAIVLRTHASAATVDVAFASSEIGTTISSNETFTIDRRHEVPMPFHLLGSPVSNELVMSQARPPAQRSSFLRHFSSKNKIMDATQPTVAHLYKAAKIPSLLRRFSSRKQSLKPGGGDDRGGRRPTMLTRMKTMFTTHANKY
ncbi:Aste57867_7692 [Aphanomyces stellatus]|uniref:Aste57867_7692 protein n=1 Tax=Aphanomyces stellatus TaxID=120398 RepID=A0A485KIM8_9STRA|nr:hypothetical protein As57867_007663 [Aphanomyces stellatus]VFT84595.1 Aste57867_7692 [Aphanomyces stellatus]